GERIKPDDINKLYKEIGDTFKQKFNGYSAWVISSHMDAIKHIGLRPSGKHKLFNGPLECRYVGFDMYEGTKKEASSKYSRSNAEARWRDDKRKNESQKDNTKNMTRKGQEYRRRRS
ncbi:MAG: hypothetical protein K8S16_01875, partial [Bacteroidales bacterium]|nr:hypothetical protein [Bacteroidales bacterium]